MTFDLTRSVVSDDDMTRFANDHYGGLFKVRYISLFEGIDFASRVTAAPDKYDLYNLDQRLSAKGYDAANDEEVGDIFGALNCPSPHSFSVCVNSSKVGDGVDLIVKRPDPRTSLAQRIGQFVGVQLDRADTLGNLREACPIDNLRAMQNLVTALEFYRADRKEIAIDEYVEWQVFTKVCHSFVEYGGDLGTVRQLRDALLLSSIRYNQADNDVTGFMGTDTQQAAIAEIRDVTLMCAQRDTGASSLTWENISGFEYLVGLNGAVEFFGSLPFRENDALRTSLYMNLQGEELAATPWRGDFEGLDGDLWSQTLLHISAEAARAAERLQPITTGLVGKIRPLMTRVMPDPRLGLN